MNNEEMKSRIESAKRRYEEKLKTRKFSVQQSSGIPLGEIVVLCAESDVGKSCLYSNTENTV